MNIRSFVLHAAACAIGGALAAMSTAGIANAQNQREPFPPSQLMSLAGLARDLTFPTEASTLSSSSVPTMALYKPDGPGPFPAVVLHHQCGGLRNSGWQNQSMLDWAREAVSRGYVAFLIDSLGPRGIDTLCSGLRGGVNFMRGVRDAMQAAAHLHRFDFVDKERIAMAGYSWGAMIGVAASSKLWGETLGVSGRFAAIVSLYPGCVAYPAGGPPYDIARRDIDRPLLVMMGELDNETPPPECVPRLEAAKAAGAPVEWHIYPQTTHCWDCKNLDGFSKFDSRGTRVIYRYSRENTQDAADRMFAFLDRHMTVKR